MIKSIEELQQHLASRGGASVSELAQETRKDSGVQDMVYGEIRPRGNEHEEQKALFKWAKKNEDNYPALVSLFAIPNGGKRHIGTAKKLKAEGVKAGVPDVCLPCPRGEYVGLFIEMKYGKNKPTKLQESWIELLRSYGWLVKVCYSAEAAQEVIIEYLNQTARKAA